MSCPKLAEGDVVRLTRVDACGAPDEGDGNAFVDDCWSSVVMSPNIEAGTEIKFKAMNGRSCGAKKGCDTFNWFDITGTFYSASPEMIELMTGQPVYDDFDGNAVGWDDCAIACTAGFGLELWQNVIGEECVVGEEGIWFYWLLPWIENGRLGDVTVSAEGVTFTLTGSTRASGGWSLGPWDVQDNDGAGTAGPLLTAMGADCHRRGFLTSISPPTPACEAIATPANNTPGS